MGEDGYETTWHRTKNTFLAVKDAGFNIQESAQMLAKFYEDILQNKIDSMVEIK